jgi:hypothetical protein
VRVRARAASSTGVVAVAVAQSRHAHGTVARLVGRYRDIRGSRSPIGGGADEALRSGCPQPPDARTLPCVRALARTACVPRPLAADVSGACDLPADEMPECRGGHCPARV